MHLKRFISQFIPLAPKKYFWAVFVIVLGFNNIVSGQKKFQIVNPCTINYNSLPNSNSGSTGGSGGSNAQQVDPRTIYYTATTFADTTSNTTDWSWSFGDATPIKTGKIVQHQYLASGTYTVTLNRKINGIDQPPVTEIIQIQLAPTIPYFLSSYSKRDTSLCEPFLLDPYKKKFPPSNVSYEWYPDGSTKNTLMADTSDLYSLKVTDKTNGCYVIASIMVNICGSVPLNSRAEYHFGDGIKRVANHGNAQSATEFPGGVDFKNDGVISSQLAASSIQNPNAYRYMRYLFTSDGINLFGSTGNKISSLNPAENNIPLAGVGNTARSTLIVPKIEGDTSATTQYYIFTINNLGELSYSLLETRSNTEGDGVIIEKNVFLLGNMSDKLTASAFFQSSGVYYVVTHDKLGNYYTFKVSKFGLEGPVKSPSPNSLGGKAAGQLKFSPDNKKTVLTIPGPSLNYLEVCDFDSTNGTSKNCIQIPLGAGPPNVNGVEFSQNGKYIYYTLNREGSSDPNVKSQLIRLDLTNNNAKLIIETSSTQNFGALQNANLPANKTEILMAIEGEKQLASIQNPNVNIPDSLLLNNSPEYIQLRHDLLEYKFDQYKFSTAKSTLGLNNSTSLPSNNSPSGDSFDFELNCINEPVAFQASPGCDVKEVTYEWDFGDGSPTGSGQKPSHTYTKSGKFKVRLFITYCSKAPIILEDEIIILPKAIVDLKEIYENCFRLKPNFEIVVNLTNKNEIDGTGFENQIDYEWAAPILPPQNLSNIMTITKKGQYNVDVDVAYTINGNPKTCPANFKTTVEEYCDPILVVPTVYTPNNDSSNDRLEITQQDVDGKNFEFRIYNRWGELVYFSNKLAETKWDGKFNNKDCEPDTYAWTAKYRSVFKPNGLIYRNQGALLLVR